MQIVLTPAVGLFLLYRGIRNHRYFAEFAERLGFLPNSIQTTGAGAIWFHAVSVGEVLSCAELFKLMRVQQPYTKMFVSTATLAGRDAAEQKLAGLVDGVFFAPLDYRSIVRRVLRRLRPSAVVVIETEIWPNLYRESKRAGASLMIVNGRISDRALPRYTRWRWFFRHVLECVDGILAQTEEDARRFVMAGARVDQVRVAGNLKYDFKPPAAGAPPDIADFLDELQPRAVWIAASTMLPTASGDIDEDDAVLRAFADPDVTRPGLLLILAPRKPERFDAVARKLVDSGIGFVRRTNLGPLSLPGVLLLDSIGELAALFERADVVFMGGTLARRGGHNILEPAYFAKPVIVGPHMENFAGIAEEFREANALEQIETTEQLAAAVERLLDEPSRAKTLGERARTLAVSKRGVGKRIAEQIFSAAADGIPDPPRTLLARIFLTPLSWLWSAGHHINRSRQLARKRSLAAPVISIGGLAMGGSGKSPMVAYLASLLRKQGRTPAILTRGYRRRSHEHVVIVPRGEQAATALTGDEAQIYVRAGDAHVGIGADRYEVGSRMEEMLAPDVFLLDDGFQHVRLARTQDVVLIDALDPLAGGMFPLGRRREPLENLQRASAIVITRVEPSQEMTGLKRLLRRHNPHVPIFTSRIAPCEWIDLKWGTARDAKETKLGRVAAFCGLGNPDAFWRTLDDLGVEVTFRWAFGDHHHYRPAELRRLAQQAAHSGAETLVTTEKDVMNLCGQAAELAAPLKVLWLKIGIEIDKEEEFLRHIL